MKIPLTAKYLPPQGNIFASINPSKELATAEDTPVKTTINQPTQFGLKRRRRISTAIVVEPKAEEKM